MRRRHSKICSEAGEAKAGVRRALIHIKQAPSAAVRCSVISRSLRSSAPPKSTSTQIDNCTCLFVLLESRLIDVNLELLQSDGL